MKKKLGFYGVILGFMVMLVALGGCFELWFDQPESNIKLGDPFYQDISNTWYCYQIISIYSQTVDTNTTIIVQTNTYTSNDTTIEIELQSQDSSKIAHFYQKNYTNANRDYIADSGTYVCTTESGAAATDHMMKGFIELYGAQTNKMNLELDSTVVKYKYMKWTLNGVDMTNTYEFHVK